MVRAIRFHFDKFLKEVKQSDIEKAQLGLGHAYSRAKVKFNINKADNMITQAISMLDQLDKDMNTFTMRLRYEKNNNCNNSLSEWYAWHFPELNKIVRDNLMFAKLVKLIKDKSSVNSESEHAITEVTGDEALSQEIVSAAKSSMGLDLAEFDMINIEAFSDKVISLGEYRKQLFVYLQDKMHTVAPNLTVLLGEQVGARLISHAGSLMSLSKYPASTVQILGAEKALFRALKTKGKTPKYGLLYHSSFIGRASKQNKGRISRYLANKCSIAVRMDAFQDFPTTKYGEELKDQVEQRLAYYEANGQGVTMKKNVEVMKTVKTKLKDDIAAFEADKKKPVVSNKRKREQEDEAVEEEQPKKKSKKEKKEKKEKKSKKQEDEAQPEEQAPEEDAEPPKKKQKLSKEEKKLRKDKKKKAAVAEEDE